MQSISPLSASDCLEYSISTCSDTPYFALPEVFPLALYLQKIYISKTTKNFLPFWAFPLADKLTSVPFFPNVKILKPCGDHNLKHDLQIRSRQLSGKTVSSEHCLRCWTQPKRGNVVVVVNDDDDNNSKQMLAHGLEPCSRSM